MKRALFGIVAAAFLVSAKRRAPISRCPTEEVKMSRLFKVVTLVLLVFLAANSLFAQEQPKAAGPAYILSIFVGFGLGQYYLGQNGTPFLVGDLIGMGMVLAGMELVLTSFFAPSVSAWNDTVNTGCTAFMVGGIVFLVSRIWEIIDIFGAVNRARKAGKVAEVVPVIDVDIQRTSFELGVNLRY
jgi:hypothetical protein